jgi:hypothetical protein
MDSPALEGPHGILGHGSCVESYAGLHQQFPILLFERHPEVVFFLPLFSSKARCERRWR